MTGVQTCALPISSMGWLAQEVDEYIQSRVTASRGGGFAESELLSLKPSESAA